MNVQMGISRDWRAGMVEWATLGYDYEPPNPLAPWFVREGRTASGVQMDRTDEPMIETSMRHFATSEEAAAWVRAEGYR